MSNNPVDSARDLTFSQRYGYVPLPGPMRLEELSDDLRREIWNLIREFLVSLRYISQLGWPSLDSSGERFVERVIGNLLKRPQDEIDTSYENVSNSLREIVIGNKYGFNKTLDLVEIFANDGDVSGDFPAAIEHLFESHAAAYRFDVSQRPFRFCPRSSREQGKATQQALETIVKGGMDGAATHLRDAMNHINSGQYSDSVFDSISAVESVSRRIAPETKTLGAALKVLEGKGLLTNKQLKSGFEKLYAYTNDEEGIRHALMSKGASDVDIEESIFMFGACASFAAYLVSKYEKLKNDRS